MNPEVNKLSVLLKKSNAFEAGICFNFTFVYVSLLGSKLRDLVPRATMKLHFFLINEITVQIALNIYAKRLFVFSVSNIFMS